jgi:hypothetical protein
MGGEFVWNLKTDLFFFFAQKPEVSTLLFKVILSVHVDWRIIDWFDKRYSRRF